MAYHDPNQNQWYNGQHQQQQGYPPSGGHPQQQQGYGAPQHQAPPQAQQQNWGQPASNYQSAPAAQGMVHDSGNDEGIAWSIMHRDTNTLLSAHLNQGASLKAKPGSMIHMSANIDMKGQLKFSMKKMFTGGEMSETYFTGPGEVAIAPSIFGDIIAIRVQPNDQWRVGKDGFLASTPGIKRESKGQGIGKAFFSGEGFFVSHVKGAGVIWLSSFGAIVKKEIRPGEQHIVDNGHLVAWNCNYEMVTAGGMKNAMVSGEGRVCKFTGPGTVYIQSRNPEEFASWAKEIMGVSSQ